MLPAHTLKLRGAWVHYLKWIQDVSAVRLKEAFTAFMLIRHFYIYIQLF